MGRRNKSGDDDFSSDRPQSRDVTVLFDKKNAARGLAAFEFDVVMAGLIGIRSTEYRNRN